MLELLAIGRLCRFIDNLMRAKGRQGGWFQLLAILLWIGGEVFGAVIGIALGLDAGAYLLALAGGGAGAYTAYRIARAAAPAASLSEVFE
jgi:hypothetical protein